MKKFLDKHLFIKYMVVGALCTVINIVCYFILFYLFKARLACNIAAYIITLITSFFLNKKYVFNNATKDKKSIVMQFTVYTTVRLTSLFIDSFVLILCVEKLHLSDLLGKIISNACTTVNNYIFNKLIFRK